MWLIFLHFLYQIQVMGKPPTLPQPEPPDGIIFLYFFYQIQLMWLIFLHFFHQMQLMGKTPTFPHQTKQMGIKQQTLLQSDPAKGGDLPLFLPSGPADGVLFLHFLPQIELMVKPLLYPNPTQLTGCT